MVCLLALLGFLGLTTPVGETCAATARCAEACSPKDPQVSLEVCVARCAARAEPTVARPLFDALQRCSKPACGPRCVEPSSLTCRMCVLASCSTEVGNCMAR